MQQSTIASGVISGLNRLNTQSSDSSKANTLVNREISQMLDQAKQREHRLRRLAVEADSQLPQVIERLRGLSSIGLLSKNILFGPIVLIRSDDYGLADEGDTIIQAALSTNVGPVALFWSGDEFINLNRFSCLETEAIDRAVPISQCSIAIRGLIWLEVSTLLKRALNQVSCLRVAEATI